MVLIRKEDGYWKGILVDGYLPKRRILEALYESIFTPSEIEPEPRAKEQSIDNLAYDFLTQEMTKYCKSLRQKCPSLIEKRRGRIQAINSCDLYILELSRRIKQPLGYLSEEFNYEKNKSGYRTILLFANECPEPDGCIKQALERMDFKIKQRNQYENYTKFEETCNKILTEGLHIFVAPCSVLAEKLKESGLILLY